MEPATHGPGNGEDRAMSDSRDTAADETPTETDVASPGEAEAQGGDNAASATTDTPPPASPSGKAAGPGRGHGVLLALAFILILTVAGAAGYGGWWLYEAKQATTERLSALEERDDARAERLADRIEELATAHAEERAALATRQAEQAEALEALTATTEGLEQRLGRTGSDWTLAEVAHLLRTARHREHLADDGEGAAAALAAADGRLAELDDPALQPVREAIATALQRLAGRDSSDISGLSARLGALAATVDELPLRRPGDEGEPIDAAEEVTTREGWRRHLDTVLETLGELVVIRRHDEAVEALVPPEQDALLRLNLRLQLESAQVALLRGDEALFRNHVQRARDWLGHYFDGEAEATRSALETLDDAADASLTTARVDLSEPLAALAEATGGEAP